MARLARLTSVLATLAITSALLASCGNSGAIADARHSCVFVKRALAIELQSEQSSITSSRRRALQANALSELLKATPSAAAATSIDGSWNPLMTTINEAERVPIPNLVDSLTRLCKVADSSNPYL
ncbi:MAG TPA: hypothetical protein VGP11_05060 [Acidimicrobiales bacterium]|nr:hypothetical protein [Acidimicrobiales bacterium]